MGLSTGIGIGIQFSRGGGQSWESYWATRKPTGLTLSLIAGEVYVEFNDSHYIKDTMGSKTEGTK